MSVVEGELEGRTGRGYERGGEMSGAGGEGWGS